MPATNYALFDTDIGRCGIAWTERGIFAVQLPESNDTATSIRLRRQFDDSTECEPHVLARSAIRLLSALLAGTHVDLTALALDFDQIPDFSRRVYEHTRRIPPGSVISYGKLATRMGAPQAARAVGQALGRNRWPLIVPCHRVLAANGNLTGFSAPGGVLTKRRLLAIEGVAT